jgi:hypothetical protein
MHRARHTCLDGAPGTARSLAFRVGARDAPHLFMSRHIAAPIALSLFVAAMALGTSSRAEAQVHLIAGVEGEGGGFVDRSEGAIGGVGAHLGVHIVGFELYGLSQAFIGGLTAGPNSGSVTGLWWNSAMIGFGAGPFHLAAGPSLDFAWGCRDQNDAGRCYHGDNLFGLDGRVALQLASFLVSFDVHPTFYRGSTVTAFVFGVGWEL